MKKDGRSDGFQPRLALRPVVELLGSLSEAQKSMLREMGFGGLLHFKCTYIEEKACKWLIDAFDVNTGRLCVHGQQLEITVGHVHRLFGLHPEGDDGLYEQDADAKAIAFGALDILSGNNEEIKLKDLFDDLKEMKDAGIGFRVKVGLYLFDKFLCSTSRDLVTTSMAATFVRCGRHWNWAKIVLNCLVDDIRNHKNGVGYCNGLVFLLLIFYCHYFSPNSMTPRAKNDVPAASFWDNKTMQKRMRWWRINAMNRRYLSVMFFNRIDYNRDKYNRDKGSNTVYRKEEICDAFEELIEKRIVKVLKENEMEELDVLKGDEKRSVEASYIKNIKKKKHDHIKERPQTEPEHIIEPSNEMTEILQHDRTEHKKVSKKRQDVEIELSREQTEPVELPANEENKRRKTRAETPLAPAAVSRDDTELVLSKEKQRLDMDIELCNEQTERDQPEPMEAEEIATSKRRQELDIDIEEVSREQTEPMVVNETIQYKKLFILDLDAILADIQFRSPKS